MPAWITTYLQQIPSGLTAESVRRGIDSADWWTLGEDVGLDSDGVDAFMAQLRWADDDDDVLDFHVEPERRPVQIHVWTEPGRVAEEVQELDERVSIPSQVRRHLRDVRAVVAIELGWSQLQTMYEVVAFEVAYWLAERFGGVILSPADYWHDHADHRWNPIESGT